MKSLLGKAIKKTLNVLNLERFDENRFGEAGGRELRILQMKSVYSLTSAMMLGNIVFAILLTVNLIGQGTLLDLLALSWCLVLIGVSLFTLKKSKSRAKLNKEYSG